MKRPLLTILVLLGLTSIGKTQSIQNSPGRMFGITTSYYNEDVGVSLEYTHLYGQLFISGEAGLLRFSNKASRDLSDTTYDYRTLGNKRSWYDEPAIFGQLNIGAMLDHWACIYAGVGLSSETGIEVYDPDEPTLKPQALRDISRSNYILGIGTKLLPVPFLAIDAGYFYNRGLKLGLQLVL